MLCWNVNSVACRAQRWVSWWPSLTRRSHLVVRKNLLGLWNLSTWVTGPVLPWLLQVLLALFLIWLLWYQPLRFLRIPKVVSNWASVVIRVWLHLIVFCWTGILREGTGGSWDFTWFGTYPGTTGRWIWLDFTLVWTEGHTLQYFGRTSLNFGAWPFVELHPWPKEGVSSWLKQIGIALVLRGLVWFTGGNEGRKSYFHHTRRF